MPLFIALFLDYQLQLLDNQYLEKMSNKTHTRIASIYDLRIYLSKLLNQTQRGQVSVERSKAICTVARLLMECLEKEKDLQTEETLEEMEKTLGLEQP